MTKPNFLIIGAAKSGTTSVYHYLRDHPQVFMPAWKEPAFYAPAEAGGINDETEYFKLFEDVQQESTIGEASVAYLYAPQAAQKICENLGKETKILIFLRNPIDMAYSNWGHQVREGHETLPFEQAIDKNRPKPDKLNTWAADLDYLDRAHYKAQIEPYDALFGEAKIKIFIYEEFFKPGLPYWDELCEFLNISKDFRPEEKVHNAAGKMRSPLLRDVLRKRMAWKEPLKLIIPQKARLALKDKLEKLNRVEKKMPHMADKTRKDLQETFSEDVRWLEKRLNRPLSDVWF